MNFITGKHVERRSFLRGLGAVVALPLLDAMTPALASASAASATKAPLRMAFSYVPNGVTIADWTPAAVGTDFTLPRILASLAPYRENLLVLTGLAHRNAEALGDGAGDHARAGACFLTGVHPKKTAGADIHAGISVDQIAARKFDSTMRLSSLELGCEDSRTVGNCDSGYSCAYTNSISWRSATTPNPPETNPRLAFERLFGTEDFSVDPETRARRALLRESILDVVNARTQKLVGTLGASDKRKMDEYLTGVREVEKRIQMAEKDNHQFIPSIEKPAGIPEHYGDYVKLMYDLQVLAYQSDTTRVSSLQLGREGSVRTYGEIGVPDPHHPLSHHRNIPELMDKISKINTFHVSLFGYFLERLKATKEGDGTLLDNTMLVYGSAICDGNAHTHADLPVLVAGGSGSKLNLGRHLQYQSGTPMANLYISLLERMDVNVEHLGDSTGELQHLSDI
ncbi:MAG: DUF1552 domain-containing protein [Acidobacteriota bacterium]|nr:DUF1552 domain-containing protein [Acidobacteriota bacterium]